MISARVLVLFINTIACVSTLPLVKSRVYPQVCLTSSDCEAVNQICARLYHNGYGYCFAKEDSKIVSLANHEQDKSYLIVRGTNPPRNVDPNRAKKDQNQRSYFENYSVLSTTPPVKSKQDLDETLPEAFTTDDNTLLSKALINDKTEVNEVNTGNNDTEGQPSGDQASEKAQTSEEPQASKNDQALEDQNDANEAVTNPEEKEQDDSDMKDSSQTAGHEANSSTSETKQPVNNQGNSEYADVKPYADQLKNDQMISQTGEKSKSHNISKRRSLDLDIDLDTAMEDLVLVNGSYALRPKLFDNTTVEMKGNVDVKVTHKDVRDPKRLHETVSTISPVEVQKVINDLGPGLPEEVIPYVDKIKDTRVDYDKLTNTLENLSEGNDANGANINNLKTQNLKETVVQNGTNEKNNKRVHKPVNVGKLDKGQPKPTDVSTETETGLSSTTKTEQNGSNGDTEQKSDKGSKGSEDKTKSNGSSDNKNDDSSDGDTDTNASTNDKDEGSDGSNYANEGGSTGGSSSSDDDDDDDDDDERFKRSSEDEDWDQGFEEHNIIKRQASFVKVRGIPPDIKLPLRHRIVKRRLTEPVDVVLEQYRFRPSVGELTARVYNLNLESDRTNAYKSAPKPEERKKRAMVELYPANDEADVDKDKDQGGHSEENLSRDLIKDLQVVTDVPATNTTSPEPEPDETWSECSVTCGLGVRRKKKICSDGSDCPDSPDEGEVKPCMKPICS